MVVSRMRYRSPFCINLLVQVYSRLQSLPHRFFHNQPIGSLIARRTNDTEAVENIIAHRIPEMTIAVVLPTAIVGVLFYLNW